MPATMTDESDDDRETRRIYETTLRPVEPVEEPDESRARRKLVCYERLELALAQAARMERRLAR